MGRPSTGSCRKFTCTMWSGLAGLMVFSGAVIGFYNIVRTVSSTPEKSMKMTPEPSSIGSLLILAAVVFVVVFMPMWPRSRPRLRKSFETERSGSRGRKLYMANGCVYCHSQSIRTIDWGLGAERIAQAGDYVADHPILLGSQRTGPDLSQEGGEHPDDWHTGPFHEPALHAAQFHHAVPSRSWAEGIELADPPTSRASG